MPYVDHLIRAGVLRGLDPLTRPLAQDVARLMGAMLGWNANDIAQQVAAYGRQVALTRRFDPTWKLTEAQHERT